MRVLRLLVIVPRFVVVATWHVAKILLMAVGGAFGRPSPPPFRHVDDVVQIAEDRKP